MNVGKLVAAAALLLPNAVNACKCQRPPVCEGVENADAVLRAVLVSSSDSENTFWADTVFKVVEVFKFETGLEKYAVDEEIHAFSPGSTNSCGAWTEFGEKYLVDLHRGSGDGLYTGVVCGIHRSWIGLSEDDEESLRSCTCDGGCGTFQECVPNPQGYLLDGVAVETYCADVCVPTPCSDGEVCELLPVPCIEGTVCPPLAVCTPATSEPSPAPTAPPTMESCVSWAGTCPDTAPIYQGDTVSCDGICDETTCCRSDGIISCGSYECGEGYTNVERECSTVPSPPGRRLQSSDDEFFTSDGYTTLGNYPICSQDVCCEGPTPAGPLSPGCFKDVGGDRIMSDRALVDYSMTTELCQLTCAGSSYFSTQYGRECWCGPPDTDYAKHGESTGCTYECPGNPDETCGGFYAASVYAYKAASSYVGCFQDGSDRIMGLALSDGSSMTTETCEAVCTGSTYYGLQYGRECWCGDQDTDLLQHGESTACNYECSGDPDEICGGFWAMSVYSP